MEIVLDKFSLHHLLILYQNNPPVALLTRKINIIVTWGNNNIGGGYMDINCTSNCLYQLEGKCNLSELPSLDYGYSSNESDCPYFETKLY